MLAFDIETLGLNHAFHDITVAAVCDRKRNIHRCYNFITGGCAAIEDFLRDLDEADILCSFNGAKFDIPFIIARFKVPRERWEKWYLKLFDYYEVARLVFGTSLSLNTLLCSNGYSVKTGSGLQAIQWAKSGEYAKLASYCQDDADLTYDISTAADVKMVMRNHQTVRVRRFEHDWNRHQFSLPV